MTLIRSLLFLLFLALVVIAHGSFVLLFGRWMSREQLLGLARHWSRTLLAGLQRLCGLSYRIRGLENLPDQPFIMLVKHQSAWETIAIPGIIPRQQAWVLKQELMRVPFFGWALRFFKPIALDRKAGRKALRQLLDEGKAQLAAGQSILVFPEGTRVAVGQQSEFNIGGAMLAEKSGAPVVPITHNAGVFWRRRGVRKLAGKVDLVIGPPIETKGLSAKEINQLAAAWINKTAAQLPQSPA